MRKLLYEGNSILIATQKEGGGPVVIQSSGYTADIKAATNENCFITQLRTVPHRDRRNDIYRTFKGWFINGSSS